MGKIGLHQFTRQRREAIASTLRRVVAPLAAGMLMSLPFITEAQQTAARPAAPQLQASALAQMATLKQVKASKTPTQNKIDSRLYLGMLNQKGDARMAGLPDFRFIRPESDGRIAVDLVVRKPAEVIAVWSKLAELKAVVATDKGVAFSTRTVRARVTMSDVEKLAAMDQVMKVRTAIPAFTSQATTPLTVSQGVRTHGANLARSTFGAQGAGQTICVLSDGATSVAASQASGDLPSGNQLFILPGQVGSGDEGTAMMEIVYDMAPLARIGFATAFTSEASFAQNILDLATAGCTIIVDDIIYLDESPFQDGPVAQAVNTVTGNGVLYFSSAGNEGNLTDATSGTWEGNFSPSAAADPAPLAGANLHNFGNGSNSILVAAGSASTPIVMIWAEHFDLTTGTASTDYDLYDLNGTLTTIFDASTDTQDGVGGDDFPIEFIGGGAFAGERLVVDQFVAGTTSSVPAFNLIIFRGRLEAALATSGATRGHSAAANAFSVAATPAATAFSTPPGPGPFPNLFSSGNVTETFSSDGPRRILLSPTGAELTPGNRTFSGGVVRQKPDITAADGVATSAPGFATFFGTSAAAPHAAAIAGLVRGALPALTMPQVRNLLTSTAIDIEAPGVDRTTGAGIVMPVPALQAGGAVGQAALTAGAAVFAQVVGDGDAFIETNETFSISLPLTNSGAVTATPVSVTLTSTTPGVTIVSGTSAYPDIAPGASASNTTAFSFRVDPGFLCGTIINFSAVATFTGTTSPTTFPLTVNTGAPGTPVTFSYTGPVVAIPDNVPAGVNVALPVSGLTSPVSDVNFRVDGATCNANTGATTVGIDHSWVGDLNVSLVSPAGTVIPVMARPGGTGNSGNNFCQTLLDDESAGINIQTIVIANAPWVGSFRPSSALSGFDGQNGNGTWFLRVSDNAGIDTGSVRAFSLTFAGAAICDAPVQNDTVPDPFTFTNVANAAVSAKVTSNTITISGINQPSPVTISRQASYSINGGPFQLTAGTINNGDTLALRVSTTTSSAPVTATVTVGGYSTTWTVTVGTDTTPDDITFGTVSNQAPGALVTTGSRTITGINAPTPIIVGQPGTLYSVNGAPFTAAAGTVVLGDTIRIQANASTTSGATVTAFVILGDPASRVAATVASLTIVTRAQDTTPTAVSWGSVSNIRPGTVYTTGTRTIQGIDGSVPVTISGDPSALFSVNGGAFTAGPATVANGGTIALRLTAPATSATTISANVTIGTYSTTFSLTTTP